MSRKTEPDAVATDDVDEALRIADALTRQTETETKKAKAREGEAARKHFAPLRQKLVEARTELAKLKAPGTKARNAALSVLDSGVVLHGEQRRSLGFHANELAGVAGGKAMNAVDSAIERLDGLGDNPQFWPKQDFCAGALANPGAAKRSIDAVVSLVKKLGDAEVRAQREVPEHPAVAEDERQAADEKRGKVITNIARRDA